MRDPLTALLVRLAVVAIVAAAIVAARPLLARWRASRGQRALNTGALAEWTTGAPLVLLFTGTQCSDCARQKDVLTRMQDVAVREVFAARTPALTQRFGIRSVPATVVLDATGRPKAVNYGLVDATVLSRQLATATILAL